MSRTTAASLSATIRRWHWGQLLIAWVFLACAIMAIMGLLFQSSGANNRAEDEAKQAITTSRAKRDASRREQIADSLLSRGTSIITRYQLEPRPPDDTATDDFAKYKKKYGDAPAWARLRAERNLSKLREAGASEVEQKEYAEYGEGILPDGDTLNNHQNARAEYKLAAIRAAFRAADNSGSIDEIWAQLSADSVSVSAIEQSARRRRSALNWSFVLAPIGGFFAGLAITWVWLGGRARRPEG
jgi:hypothetical protein